MYTAIQFADKDLSFRFWVPSRYAVTWSFFHVAVSCAVFSLYFTVIATHHLDSQGVKRWLGFLLVGIYTRIPDMHRTGVIMVTL
jgi:hypothetical protein